MDLFFTQKKAFCLRQKGVLTQTIRVMKITAFLLIVCCHFSMAAGVYSQGITLSQKNARLETLLSEIEKQSEYQFFYNERLIKQAKKVDINVSNASLEDVLDICMKNQPLNYSIIENIIVIEQKEEDIVITGKVTDAEGKPLPNATVMIKGTFKGITTNIDGEYSITVPDSKTVLVFSYVGYAKQEIKVGNKTTINVSLEQAATELEEVTINAGYYTVTEKTKTGNISRVAAKEIEQQPVANPLQAIQGRMTGVSIVQKTGLPGGGFDIQIRGINSIRREIGANSPLYIIDGVPYPSNSIAGQLSGILENNVNPLNSIDPSIIESIEILKDADATAIYGSRGSNGVVLITTKKGKVGKTTFTIKHTSGISKVPNRLDLLNTEQYLEMRLEAYENDGRTPNANSAPDLLVWDQDRYTDWQDEIIGGASFTTNTQLSVSGGNANTQFMLSSNYYTEGTVFPGDFNYKRFTGFMNLNHLSNNNKFRLSFSSNYSSDKNILPRIDLTRDALTLPPNAPALYDENGDINWENNTFTNPLAALQVKKYEGRTTAFIAKLTLNYEILKNLKAKTDLGYTDTQIEEISLEPKAFRRPDIRHRFRASSLFGDNRVKTWIIEPQIEYSHTIGKGSIQFLAGASFQETTNEGETIQGVGFASDALLKNPQAADLLYISPTSSKYRYNAIFGRLNFNWKDSYILNLTGRRDGSSRFGPDKRFANFGAVGAAWIFSNENLIKENFPFLSFGKIRGSYGTTGNDQIGDYQYLDTYRVFWGTSTYQEQIGLIPSRLPNDDFSWETNKKLELALELGFIDNRILFSTSWYRNRSSDQLVGLPLPVITGHHSLAFNLPAIIENKGWEFELHTINIKSAHFEWNSGFNLSIPRNKLVSFPDFENSGYSNVYQIGKSLFLSRLFTATGLDPETGLYTFEDMNGDDRISYQHDRSFYEVSQNYFGGLQNTIRYKNIELNFHFQFVKQKGFSYLRSFSWPGSRSNQPALVVDRWQEAGDLADVQKYTNTTFRNTYRFLGNSNAAITDQSYIRLSNLSLSYRFSNVLLKKLNLKDFRIYIQGQNLLTFTDYMGLDPGAGASLSLPPLRTITAGIELTF